ncbi:pre-rRNA processing protein [Thecaphora frezii]
MPDAFFQKKRKRTTSTSGGDGGGDGRSKGKGASSSSSSRAGPSSSRRYTATLSANKRANRKAAGDSSDDDVNGGGDDEALDTMDLQHRYDEGPDSDQEAERAETAAEARVRLAKMYLEGLKQDQDDDGADAAVADRDNIAARLQKDVAEMSGKMHAFVAKRIAPPTEEERAAMVLGVRGHRLSVTAAVVSSDATSLFTAGKEGSVVRWRLRDGKMVRVLPRRAKRLDAEGRPVAPAKSQRSKTSGAARRRERMTRNKGKARAVDGDDAEGGGEGEAAAASYLDVGEGEGHTDEIWALSISSDGKYLASGGKDRRIGIWSLGDGGGGSGGGDERWIKALGGHKDSISALSFRPSSSELYTASFDRTLKLFDVSQLSYIETLFGHQESILSMSCLRAETAVSAGGRDRTCRFWKIRDESQLVFRAGAKSKLREVLEGGDLARLEEKERQHEQEQRSRGVKEEALDRRPTELVEGSVDCVAMVDDGHFLSGGDTGSISLWSLSKKKPVFSVAAAHGFHEMMSETEGKIQTPRWITSLACLPYGDVFASGSWSNEIRLWALDANLRSFTALFSIPVVGFINSLQLVLPPPSSAHRDAASGRTVSLAIAPNKWKRRGGLASLPCSSTGREDAEEKEQDEEEEEERGRPVRGTKESVPPILVAAVGQEHKFGRWFKIKEAKNGAVVVPLSFKLS